MPKTAELHTVALRRSDRRYVRDAQRYVENGRLVFESFGEQAFMATSGRSG
ncbi:MAG TPA: hypothetical protein VFJ11_06930 [Gaiellaceae bacterium]|nr:hypothetical protein [Gaiellaceae bacterium]